LSLSYPVKRIFSRLQLYIHVFSYVPSVSKLSDTINCDGSKQPPRGAEGISRREYWDKEYRKKLDNRELVPKYVQWISTSLCNFRCPHCGTAAAEARPDELTTEEIKKQIDHLADLGTQVLSITGGEPVMRPDMFEVMQYAKDCGIQPGFVTNGYLIAELKDKLAKLEPISVLVSIDGYRENHDRIRGTEGAYKHCMEALETLEEIGTKHRGVSAVILDENLDSAPYIFDDAFEHGCSYARLQTLVSEGRAKGRENTHNEIMRALDVIWEARHDKGYRVDASEGMGFLGPLDPHLRNHEFWCGCGWGTFTIMQNGDVMGCPAIEFSALSEGNVREQNLDDIWWNGFQRFRDTLYDDLPAKCQECPHVKACAGGCWLLRVNGNSCFIEEAKEFAENKGIDWNI
jgi:radical SAM protein with 4Fe4S-binding SPASM domain